MNKADLQLDTVCLHVDRELEGNFRNSPVTPPLSVSTTFHRDSGPAVEESHGFVYSRDNQPNWVRLEKILGEIESGHAVVYGSGLAAIHSCLMFLQPSRVGFTGGYHGTREVFRQYAALKSKDDEFRKGDLIWIETPQNACGQVHTIAHYATKAHEAGAVLVVDSTFAPNFQKCLSLGADIVMHSSTKFFGGHSDLLGGVLIFKSKEDASKAREQRTVLGNGMGSMEAWLLLRSLRTFPLRVARQAQSALIVVAYLSGDDNLFGTALKSAGFAQRLFPPKAAPVIADLFHSSLPSCVGHQTALKQMSNHSPVFAMHLKTPEQSLAFPFKLKLFHVATSLGGVESMIDYRPWHSPDVDPRLLRISIGLESPVDLCWDLYRGLNAVYSSSKL